MRAILIGLFCALLASPAGATGKQDEMSCKAVWTIAATSIAAGAITTAQFPTAKTRDSWDAPRYAYLKVSIDIVDASNGITNVRLTFAESETDGGTFRATPLCVNAAPVLTCDAVKVDWNPQVGGKSWTIKPVDWGYLFGKITLTPTGEGANDTAAITVLGCME